MALSAPQLAARFGWSDQYQALQAYPDQRRAPQRLLARAITGYAEGVLPAQAIATLRGMSLELSPRNWSKRVITPAKQPIPATVPNGLHANWFARRR